MARKQRAVVYGEGALRGTIEDVARLNDGAEARVEVRLDDGRHLILPSGLLVAREDGGGYDLLLGQADLDASQPSGAPQAGDDGTLVVPIIRERLNIRKHRIETGRVAIRKVVREHQEEIDLPLLREEVEVRRVPVGRAVAEPPKVRREGDELIVPVLEEVLVVQKRLVLREELRITRRRIEHRAHEQITLHSETAQVERRPPAEDDPTND